MLPENSTSWYCTECQSNQSTSQCEQSSTESLPDQENIRPDAESTIDSPDTTTESPDTTTHPEPMDIDVSNPASFNVEMTFEVPDVIQEDTIRDNQTLSDYLMTLNNL